MKNTYETFFVNEEFECPTSRRAAINTVKKLNEHDVALYAIIINRGCNGASGGIGSACDNRNFKKVCVVRGPTRGEVETAEVRKEVIIFMKNKNCIPSLRIIE